jgi:hypothetical protein
MRVAYLIQSHKGIDQLDRLVSTLTELDPGCLVDVSHDRAGEPGAEALSRHPGTAVHLEDGGRGRFHNVARWLAAADRVGEAGGADYVVTLSGQDYPVRPPADLHAALAASGDGFLEQFPVLGPGSRWPVREGRSRYAFRWYDGPAVGATGKRRLHWIQAVNRIQPLVRVNVSYDRLRIGVRGARLPADLTCWGGSVFTSLSWRAVEHVRTVARRRVDVMAWARSSLVIEEAFFQTVLLSDGRFRFEPSSRRYYRFSAGNLGSPAVLSPDDMPEALASGAFFARKLDLATRPETFDIADHALRAGVS